jgi:hypothetical protein
VIKGDLVVVRQLYFSFRDTFPWVPGEYSHDHDYKRNMNSGAPGGVGIVVKALSNYDRAIIGNDCSVFWTRTQTVTRESSQCLKIVSAVDRSNT